MSRYWHWLLGGVAIVSVACATLSVYKQTPPTRFNYVIRPTGYHWRPEQAPTTHDIVWYGKDPTTGWTVYVGPDGRYYTFNHARIVPNDLKSRWLPHDAPN